MSEYRALPCGVTLTSNEKIKCFSLNLSPMETCVDKPCYTCGGCYGLANVFNPETGVTGPRFKTCTSSWGRNLEALRNTRPEIVAAEIVAFLKKKNELYFRWLAIGDVHPLLAPVIELTARMAEQEGLPTKFLLFTKEIETCKYLYKKFKNLSVFFSTWPGWERNPDIVHMRHTAIFPEESAVNPGYFICPGDCACCRMCWRDEETDVAFIAHGPNKKKVFKLGS